MNFDESRYQAILKTVEKPGRYVGGEIHSIHKNWEETPLKVALIFSDVYEIGMSYMGSAILYEILNRDPRFLAERVYVPWPDMEKKLIEENMPLVSLESHKPLGDFDLIGFSVPHELTYTNLLTVLKLSHIPLWSAKRDATFPLIISGGTASYNPEPYADFMDAIAVGDGEDLILQIAEDLLKWKTDRASFESPRFSGRVNEEEKSSLSAEKYKLLHHLKSRTGIYVPAFFRPEYLEDGRLREVVPLIEDYDKVEKAVLVDLNAAPYPEKMVIPNVRPVHDRIGIEVQRGCARGCRFCQAGMVERPVRERSPETVSQIAQNAARETGREEISLLSLSLGDYPPIEPLLEHLNTVFEGEPMSLSVPSTRTDSLTPGMIRAIKKVRQTGFTIAPEAGTERMRRLINKGNKREDLLKTVLTVFEEGWRAIKLYYLIGLPTETEEDLQGIVDEALEVLKIGRRFTRKPTVTVNISSFVPKPFTPFQWHGGDTFEENSRKLACFREEIRRFPGLQMRNQDPGMGFVEAIFARGDRRLAALLLKAHELGCRLDEWGECFSLEKWKQAVAEVGVDAPFYVSRVREFDEVLPWDHLFSQMKKSFLQSEYEAGLKEAFIEDCSRERCHDCGVCDFREVKNRLYLPSFDDVVFKKGHRLGLGSSLGLDKEVKPVDSLPISPEKEPVRKISTRIRFRYKKTGPAAFLGHLDMVNHLKRAIRRLKTPVAYSNGFHPQMRLSLGNPLKLGMESGEEYFDLYLFDQIDIPTWIQGLQGKLPAGLTVLEGTEIELKAPSIQVEVFRAAGVC